MGEKPNTPFQWLYDRIAGIKTPEWLANLLEELQELVISIILQIGKIYLDKITDKIIEVSKENISNEAKFKKVFDYGRIELKLVISDSNLNFLTEFLISKLKKSKTI